MNIVIAGVNLHIDCPDALLQSDDHPATYAPFINGSIPSNKLSITLDISIEINNFPVTEKSVIIFEAVDVWSMFKKGDEYFLAIKPSQSGEPFCLARFDRRIEKVTVHCGKVFVKEIDGKNVVMNPVRYPLDQLLLMYVLSQREGALVHASCIDLNGKGYLFCGRSGAGKSTISGLLVSGGHEALSDDRVIVRRTDGRFRAFGTPWAGEAGIALNGNLPLSGIFFLKHSDANRLTEIRPQEAMERLMPVTSIPWYDEKVMPDILSFCEDLAMNVPAYDLHFRPGVEVVDVLEKFASA